MLFPRASTLELEHVSTRFVYPELRSDSACETTPLQSFFRDIIEVRLGSVRVGKRYGLLTEVLSNRLT